MSETNDKGRAPSDAPYLPLADLHVVDRSLGLAGAYAGKLLADAGATVWKVEPPGGDPARRWSASGRSLDAAGDGVLFRYLHTSKRSVEVDPDSEEGRRSILGLYARCELVLDDASRHREDALGLAALRARRPDASWISITPFGATGPWRDWPANEFTLQAWCGSTASHGRAEREPLAAGGELGEYTGGLYAAIAALSAWGQALRSGQGRFVDLSLLEAMAPTFTNVAHVWGSFSGTWAVPPSEEIPGIEPTRDGHIGFCVFTGQQWQDFCLLIERPDLRERPELETMMGRLSCADEMREIVRGYTRRHSTADLLERAELLRIPVAPIGHGAMLPSLDHLREREVFVRNPRGDFLQPRVPYRPNAWAPRPFEPAPRLGAHTASALKAGDDLELPEGVEPGAVDLTPPRPSEPATESDLPLAGLRVLDCTAFWAGPWGGHVLSLLGAEVIHVEAVQRPDGMRLGSVKTPADDLWWEFGPTFAASNLGKRSVTLDLTRDEGVDLLLRLAGQCDAMIENFSARVMDQFGIDWARLATANPGLVYVRMPAFGLDGPWRDRVGFAQTMEQLSGMAWLTGYADGSEQERLPMNARGPTDPQAGLHAVFCTLLGLAHRRRTGRGAQIELPFVETALNLVAEPIAEHDVSGELLTRTGNRSLSRAPQGVYPCVEPSGVDAEREARWLAVSIEDDAQWTALVDVLGGAEWARALDAPAKRAAEHDRIDAWIAAWSARRSAMEAARALLENGIPAAAVTPWRRAADLEQLQARGFFETIDHPVAGRHAYYGLPMRFDREDAHGLPGPAPTLGEHNEEILGGLLGLTSEELDRLRAERLIGDRPVWAET